MHCFWTGEMQLGAIDGVVNTEAGWIGNREVTLVTYHTDHIKLTDLITKAAAIDCAHTIYLKTDAERKLASDNKKLKISILDRRYRKAKADDQKKQIQGTIYSKLKLSPIQATKVNAFARRNSKKANSYLTADQTSKLK